MPWARVGFSTGTTVTFFANLLRVQSTKSSWSFKSSDLSSKEVLFVRLESGEGKMKQKIRWSAFVFA